MTRFDLTSNAFFLLSAGPRADREGLIAAYEAAIDEPGADETRLTAAFHALMLPLPRLHAEIGWIGGKNPASSITALLDGTAESDAYDALPIFARANLAAHLCGIEELSAERRGIALSCLAGAEANLDLAAIAAVVNDDRQASGFPAIDEFIVEKALERLCREQCDSALAALLSVPNPAAMLGELIARYTYSERGAAFLSALVEAFDNAQRPELARLGTAIEAALDRLQVAPAPEPFDFATIAADTAAWSELARPRQLFLSARLRDEPRSLALGAAFRDTARRLAAEPGDPEAARALIGIARDAFAALPGLGNLLAQDAARFAPQAANPATTGVAPAAWERPARSGRRTRPVADTPAATSPRPWDRITQPIAVLWAALRDWRRRHRGLRIGLAIGIGAGAFLLVVLVAGRPAHDAPPPQPPAESGAPPAAVAAFDTRELARLPAGATALGEPGSRPSGLAARGSDL